MGDDAKGLLNDVKLTSDLAKPKDREQFWAAWRFHGMIAPDDALPDFLQATFPRIIEELPSASLWAVNVDPCVSWRVAAVRALFTAHESPEILTRTADEFEGFAPGIGLTHSLYFGYSAFLDPLLMTMSPWLIGMSSPRRFGSLFVLFGRTEPGFLPVQAPEMTNLLRPFSMGGTAKSTPMPNTSPEAGVAVLRFWSNRIDELFRLVLDPARYRADDGRYAPHEQLGALLTLEQLFASLQSLLAHARRDEFGRLHMLFNVLDQLDGLGFDDWERMLQFARVSKELRQLEDAIPEAARDAMLLRCRSAAAALDDMKHGFVLRERVHDGLLRVQRRSTGGWQEVSLDRAVAMYLRIVRNSTHSYTDAMKDPFKLSVFVAHEGDISDELADLALLHTLRFLIAPRPPVAK